MATKRSTKKPDPARPTHGRSEVKGDVLILDLKPGEDMHALGAALHYINCVETAGDPKRAAELRKDVSKFQ